MSGEFFFGLADEDGFLEVGSFENGVFDRSEVEAAILATGDEKDVLIGEGLEGYFEGRVGSRETVVVVIDVVDGFNEFDVVGKAFEILKSGL